MRIQFQRPLAAAILFAATAACALPARADALDSLEEFVRSTRTGRAEFTQAVTGPAREGQAATTRQSSGSFEFQRPNRFRFDYRKPFEQTIVADGQTLWLYDADLNQATARKQAQALGSTPAALVASASSLDALRKDFELKAAPDRDGLQWVQATPRNREGQVSSVRVGLRGNQLAALEILDSFGQRSLMTFTKLEVNVPLADSHFQFQPPKGAQVVRP